LEAPRNREGATDPPKEGQEAAPEPATLGGGQFLLRADAVQFHRGDLLGGRYQIEKPIGRGATGSVLQAFDRRVRSVVALKILRPDLATDERWVERLGGELRYARRLQHPNVCRVFDLGEADGHHFLSMEFAGGGSLRQRLADKPVRSWDDRIADARAVIDGLVAIHAENIVHRDVKPENVLVMDDGRLVVSDFGVAVSAGQTTYFSSKVAGTPSYMAPEVIMGDKATPRADVFSLGIVLHEILFGRRPDWQMTKQGRLLKPVIDPRASTRERALARLCVECLQDFAPDRLPDAEAVKRRFEQALAGRLQPIRGLRQRWPLAVGVAALALSGVLFVRARQIRVAPALPSAAARLSGDPADLSQSRVVLDSGRTLRCFEILPDKKTARIVWTNPTEAVDVELATGAQRPSPLLAQTYRSDCPQVSPDGSRLLYVKEDENSRAQIMLASRPDGGDAVAVTEGSSPVWLPSGQEFLFAFDSRRAAAFTLPKNRLLFPDSPPFEKRLQQIAVNESGDRVSLLFIDSSRTVSIETYSYPSMTLLQRTQTDQRVGGLDYDPVRNTLQASLPDPSNMTLFEFVGPNELSRVAKIAGTDLLGAFRTQLGFTMLTMSDTRSIVVSRSDGEQRSLASSLTSRVEIGPDDSLFFDHRLGDGRVVISRQRWREARTQDISQGPLDLYPTLADQGRSVVFVRVAERTIVSCKLNDDAIGACRTVFTDPLGPRFTVASPDGRWVAYQTTYGSTSRLRVASLENGTMRDLGAYRSTCTPIWSGGDALWVRSRAGGDWEEVDTLAARPTGRTVREIPDATALCDRSADSETEERGRFRVQRSTSRSTQIRVAERF
jgi:serine/threonine protein kinase